MVMRSPCAGAALDPPLWPGKIPNKSLSLSLYPQVSKLWMIPNKALSLSLSLARSLSLSLRLSLSQVLSLSFSLSLFLSLSQALSLSLSSRIGRCDVCVCLLLQSLLQTCSHGGRGIVEDMCYERRRAEACVD